MTNASDINALTAATKKLADAIHGNRLGSQVTYDTPSEGMLEEGGCGHQYMRNYDYEGLASSCDFLIDMICV